MIKIDFGNTPWTSESYEVESASGTLVCSLSGWVGPETTKRRASLIAAAPDLYAALALLTSKLRDTSYGQSDDVESAIAALAKARGEA